MDVIAFLHRKGGVGKTSCTFHLAGALAQSGSEVLLVDLDPQADLTRNCLGDQVLAVEQTILSIFRPGTSPPAIVDTGLPGIRIIPGTPVLSSFNLPDPDRQPLWLQRVLPEFLQALGPISDYCLVDCPPQLNLCSWTALLACQGIVCPNPPERNACQGLVSVQEFIDRAGVRLLGYLLTRVKKRSNNQELWTDDLRARYGERVFSAVVPELAAYTDAESIGQPIGFCLSKSPAARAMTGVCRELISRLQAQSERREAA